MTFTQDQIEEAALALHNIRNENFLRRCPGATPIKYEGQEREFCLANAKTNLELAEDRRRSALAIIDSVAHLSNSDLRRLIEAIEERRSRPLYHIANNSGVVERERDRLFRLRRELERREAALDQHLAAAE